MPRLLDLFCGAGGAAMGYYGAGFDDIVGVDINPQPRYPFKFVQGDALDYLASAEGFDLIHASPPCQMYSKAMKHFVTNPYPALIEPLRTLLISQSTSWAIENVVGAPLNSPAILCGTGFGMRIHRHRLFETSFKVVDVPACTKEKGTINPLNQAGRDRVYAEFGRKDPDKFWREYIGVNWMNRREGRESFPPAYTEWIGKQWLASQK